MPGRSFSSGDYRYGFNGKENDDESGMQDYGMRIYNPGLGRFLSVDPITAQYPELTPYQFASNNPVWMIDLDGLEGVPNTDPKLNGGHGSTAIDNTYLPAFAPTYAEQLLTVQNQRGHDGSQNEVGLHEFLDGVGTLPAIGEPADFCNGVIYLFEGDYLNAGISFFATIPFAGESGKAGKYVRKLTGKVDDFKKELNVIDDVIIESKKNVPNPFGRTGGPAHTDVIAKGKAEAIARGNNVTVGEVLVRTPGGKKSKRFADYAEFDGDGKIIKYHQVGKQNKNGMPIKRERDAIEDIKNATGTEVEFHPYN